MEKIILIPISLEELSSRLISDLRKSEFFNHPIEAIKADDELMTAKQTSKWLGVSLVSLYLWVKEGKIKYHRINSRLRFRKSELVGVSKFQNLKKRKEGSHE